MSKQDYVLIAAVLAETRNIEPTSRALYAGAFAEALAVKNPRFDAKRFLAAALKHDKPL